MEVGVNDEQFLAYLGLLAKDGSYSAYQSADHQALDYFFDVFHRVNRDCKDRYTLASESMARVYREKLLGRGTSAGYGMRSLDIQRSGTKTLWDKSALSDAHVGYVSVNEAAVEQWNAGAKLQSRCSRLNHQTIEGAILSAISEARDQGDIESAAFCTISLGRALFAEKNVGRAQDLVMDVLSELSRGKARFDTARARCCYFLGRLENAIQRGRGDYFLSEAARLSNSSGCLDDALRVHKLMTETNAGTLRLARKI